MSGREHSAVGAGQRVFGSTLSASGYALASDAGLTPIAPVFGCDVRSLSIQLPLPPYRTRPHAASPAPDQQYEDDVVAVDELDRQATAARHHAYEQLREGAAGLSADAIVDVRRIDSPISYVSRTADAGRVARAARPGPHAYFARTLDYQLIGTAVRDPEHRSATPRLSSLSAADLWQLGKKGWQAVDVVGGCAHRFGASLWGAVRHEVQGSTAIWAAARQAAYAQLRHELAQTGADGVIGVTTQSDYQFFEWTQRVETVGQTGNPRHSRLRREGMLVSVSILGTAVRRISARPHGASQTLRIIDLSR